MKPSPAVAAALSSGRPVVALESTILAHGMPWPTNLETARRVEQVIRDAGAVPATVAVLGGELRVGLTDAQLEHLARAEGVAKVSRRDLPIVVARGRDGATTVAATMILAAMAGIRVFVTGGLGGVHRGAAESMDVSADLQELARTEVAVVCAGAKAILDLGLTLEYLETHGVPVLGFGTDRFPAFYVRDSPHPVDARVDGVDELARILLTKWRLGLGGGVVVGNPIPAEHALDGERVEAAIEAALGEAEAQGVRGKELTPFLLARVDEAMAGDALRANVELVVANARLGARLARALAEQEKG